jgi:hypothetical protein
VFYRVLWDSNSAKAIPTIKFKNIPCNFFKKWILSHIAIVLRNFVAIPLEIHSTIGSDNELKLDLRQNESWRNQKRFVSRSDRQTSNSYLDSVPRKEVMTYLILLLDKFRHVLSAGFIVDFRKIKCYWNFYHFRQLKMHLATTDSYVDRYLVIFLSIWYLASSIDLHFEPLCYSISEHGTNYHPWPGNFSEDGIELFESDSMHITTLENHKGDVIGV